MASLPADTLTKLYAVMAKIRRFEEKIIEVYGLQDMKTPVHLCVGQEAIAAGVCVNLRREDYLFTTHRGHGHCLAKGMAPKVLYAEFYGRTDGCSRGKGGSMHPVAPELGILGTTAIVGGVIPLGVGAALAAKMQGSTRISAVFFGDGATDQGVFHESLNFATLKKLPVVFVCENNFYAVNSPLSARQPDDNLARHAQAHGLPSAQVNGAEVLEVYCAAREAIERARSGDGPTLLECRTYRWRGHVGPDCDYEKGCRPREELDQWMANCPVDAFAAQLLEAEVLAEDVLATIHRDIDEELDNALRFGRNSPLPGADEVLKHVYYEGA